MEYKEDDREGEVEKAAPEKSRPAREYKKWLKEAKEYFEPWYREIDKVNKFIEGSKDNYNSDKVYNIFWANMEVLAPSVYSRPAVPVVIERHTLGNEIAVNAALTIERSLSTLVDLSDFHTEMIAVNYDMCRASRGVLWVRYEADEEAQSETVKFDYVAPRDFLHCPATQWKHVRKVARRIWIEKEDGLERYGEAFRYCLAEKDDGDLQKKEEDKKHYKGRVPVWEIWDKEKRKVVIVNENAADLLDEYDAPLNLEGFFPCPRPAYSSLKPETLIPQCEFTQILEQLSAINETTSRIHNLIKTVKMRGFYSSSVGEQIQDIMRGDDDTILTPIAATGAEAFGNTAAVKDAIAWLPVRDIVQAIQSLVEFRARLIEDVYEITGISDIMRGSTEATETATAQQLKSRYGSIRLSRKQAEIQRFIVDCFKIATEIICEEFEPQSVLQLSQMQFEQPEMGLQVMTMMREQKTRPFILDIETDSTIQPDEDAEKQRRVEFMTSVGGFVQQAAPLVMQFPPAAPVLVEMMKFVAGGFRASREVQDELTKFGEQVVAMSQQPPEPQAPPQPAPMSEKEQVDAQFKAREADRKDAETQANIARMQAETQRQQSEAMFQQAI